MLYRTGYVKPAADLAPAGPHALSMEHHTEGPHTQPGYLNQGSTKSPQTQSRWKRMFSMLIPAELGAPMPAAISAATDVQPAAMDLSLANPAAPGLLTNTHVTEPNSAAMTAAMQAAHMYRSSAMPAPSQDIAAIQAVAEATEATADGCFQDPRAATAQFQATDAHTSSGSTAVQGMRNLSPARVQPATAANTVRQIHPHFRSQGVFCFTYIYP